MEVVIGIGSFVIYLIIGAFVAYFLLDDYELDDSIYTGLIICLWPITGFFIGLEKLEELIRRKFNGGI